VKRAFFGLVVLLLSCGLTAAQTYKVLWSFAGAPTDGGPVVSNLITDRAGNLYGTTAFGGKPNNSQLCGLGCGTVFELLPNGDGTWRSAILYNFCSGSDDQCADGALPWAGLVFDRKGNLYGTTAYGGNLGCPITSDGCGTIFKLSPPSLPGGAWTERVLYTFCKSECSDGALPFSQLTFDTSGNLYGTTLYGGGLLSGGTVFELSPGSGGWTYKVLHSFCVPPHGRICPDGLAPEAGVTFDRSGNLYGTTASGGSVRSSGGGTLYRLTPGSSGWTDTVLLGFLGPNVEPLGTVTFDREGNLYSTLSGGLLSQGAVFELSPGTGTYRSFSFDGADGATPQSGVLIDPRTNAVYGTTFGGGNTGSGIVFAIGPEGKETVLYSFCQESNCADGGEPVASLISDDSGNVYGTTKVGGAYGMGVVFEITP
jgi:uncharacterized repeat protein (TIGR03803 family)